MSASINKKKNKRKARKQPPEILHIKTSRWKSMLLALLWSLGRISLQQIIIAHISVGAILIIVAALAKIFH